MLFTKFKKHVHYTIHSFQVSFVVPSDSIAGRMGLLITLVLVLINLFVNCTRESPNSDSFTLVSTWMVFCIFFISLAICEYGVILMVNHYRNYFTNGKRNQEGEFSTVIGYIDTIFLMICILLFLSLNIIYWSSIDFWGLVHIMVVCACIKRFPHILIKY